MDVLEGYDRSLPCDSKAGWLAAKLGMQLPTSANRRGTLPHCFTSSASDQKAMQASWLKLFLAL